MCTYRLRENRSSDLASVSKCENEKYKDSGQFGLN